MNLLAAVPLLLLLADEAPQQKWVFDSKEDGITLSRRDHPGSEFREYQASGMVDAAPMDVWKILTDFPNYKKITAYAEKVEVRETEDGGKVNHLYVLTNPPMIDKRDYCLKYVDQSDWQDGKGYLQLGFAPSNKAPPTKEGVVRLTKFEGQWRVEPREDGKKSFVVYSTFTEPGGALPAWIVNSLASGGLKDMLRGVRKLAVPKP